VLHSLCSALLPSVCGQMSSGGTLAEVLEHRVARFLREPYASKTAASSCEYQVWISESELASRARTASSASPSVVRRARAAGSPARAR